MAGRQISVMGKQTFSMNFASGNTPAVILGARAYTVTDTVSGVLMVRVTSTSGMPTGSSFLVVMTNTLIMPDDPTTLYTPYGASPSAVATAYVTVAATDGNFPRLYTAGFSPSSTNPIGAMVTFALLPVYGSATGQGTITLAVDVVMRDA